uniref:Uncharacterized protein n=1 Tax=Arundo donax TaxID=35708 RepID=A0A0A8ZSD0_ARUDO
MNFRLVQGGGTVSSFERMMFKPYEAFLTKFILPENTGFYHN